MFVYQPGDQLLNFGFSNLQIVQNINSKFESRCNATKFLKPTKKSNFSKMITLCHTALDQIERENSICTQTKAAATAIFLLLIFISNNNNKEIIYNTYFCIYCRILIRLYLLLNKVAFKQFTRYFFVQRISYIFFVLLEVILANKID